MLRLHDNLASGNGYKARLLLRWLGLPFERLDYDLDAAATRTPEFLALNPNGRIPLLEYPDGRRLAESNAILCHLAEGTPWMPADPWDRAQAMQWLFFEQYSHEPNIATVRFWITHRTPMTPWLAESLVRKREAGYAALRVMDGHLADRDWFVGDRATVADIALFAYTHVAEEGGFDLAPFRAVHHWIDRFQSLPGWTPIDRP
ncbi:MAG TPA: glutathione S-transferase family protein [Alphaproteobacteria bacterium]|nr:glutathione S-transferase family protein [Alphaproteobacteria bacterium]